MKKKFLSLLLLLIVSAVVLAAQPDSQGDVNLTVKVPTSVEPEDIYVTIHRGNGNTEVPLTEGNSVAGLTSYTGTVENNGSVGGVKISVAYKVVNPDGSAEYVMMIGEVKDNKMTSAIDDFESDLAAAAGADPPDPDLMLDTTNGNVVNSDNLLRPDSNNISFTAGVNYDPTAPEPPYGNVYHQEETYVIGGIEYKFSLIKPGEITSYYTSEVDIKTRAQGSKRERRSSVELSDNETPGNFKVTSAEEGGQ